jgi:hypothetical protein
MNELESLLTDDFVQFSTKISEIHNLLKTKNETVKKVLDTYKEDKLKLEAEAKALLLSWETRKKEMIKK